MSTKVRSNFKDVRNPYNVEIAINLTMPDRGSLEGMGLKAI